MYIHTAKCKVGYLVICYAHVHVAAELYIVREVPGWKYDEQQSIFFVFEVFGNFVIYGLKCLINLLDQN